MHAPVLPVVQCVKMRGIRGNVCVSGGVASVMRWRRTWGLRVQQRVCVNVKGRGADERGWLVSGGRGAEGVRRAGRGTELCEFGR